MPDDEERGVWLRISPDSPYGHFLHRPASTTDDKLRTNRLNYNRRALGRALQGWLWPRMSESDAFLLARIACTDPTVASWLFVQLSLVGCISNGAPLDSFVGALEADHSMTGKSLWRRNKLLLLAQKAGLPLPPGLSIHRVNKRGQPQ